MGNWQLERWNPKLVMGAAQSFIFVVGSTLILAVCLIVFRFRAANTLDQVPGPLLAKLTSYYITLIDVAGNRTRHIHSLHQKYGPVVRIGPNEVSFTASSVAKELYSQGTAYMKAPWYEYMSTPPVGIFSIRDKQEHAARRRLLRHAFSPAAVNDTEPVIAALNQQLLEIVKTANGEPIDMLQYCRRLALDVVGQLFMGQSFEALNGEKPPEFFEWMDNGFIDLGIKYAFPPVHKLLGLIPLKGPRNMVLAAERINEYGAKSFYRYIEENGRRPDRRDMLTKILRANDESDTVSADNVEEKATGLSDRVIYLEVGNLIFAGTDTTSITLTYILYKLAQNQHWQDRLREELRTHTQEDVIVPSYSSIAELPILDAIINENLRLHTAAPASLPRETPAGGRTLDGYFIPEGTIVSMQSYTTHRDPLAFPDPETWDPTRWLASITDTIDHARVKDVFMPFSKGPRNCLGQYLAMVELKLTTATLVRKMKVRCAPETTAESMEIVDHFLAVPKSGKCLLQFEVA